MDRIVFFLVAAGVCGTMYPISDPQFRWVASTFAFVYLGLAVLTTLEQLSNRRRGPGSK